MSINVKSLKVSNYRVMSYGFNIDACIDKIGNNFNFGIYGDYLFLQ